MQSCIFCKIIKGEIPANIRFEDDDFVAFDDIKPKAKTHILIVPRRHIHSLSATQKKDEVILSKLLLTAKNLAQKEGLESYRLVLNSGRDAGQEVDHLHLHLLGGNKLGGIA